MSRAVGWRCAASVARVDPRPVGDSLRSLGRQWGLAEPSSLDAVTEAWGLVAGRLATVCEPRSIRDGVLVVAVAEPQVAEAVRWEAQGWCERLGRLVPEAAVRSVEPRLERP